MKRKTGQTRDGQHSMTERRRKVAEDESERYFTPGPAVEQCVDVLREVLREKKYRPTRYLDFSAGDGRVVRALLRHWPELKTQQYDLEPKGRLVQQSDWFAVRPNPAHKVSVLGFNPPYGHRLSLCERFLQHAATFNPRFMWLLMPEATITMALAGYEIVRKDVLPPIAFELDMVGKAVEGCALYVLERAPAVKNAFHVEHEKFEWPSFVHINCPNTKDQGRSWYSTMCALGVRWKGANAGRQLFLKTGDAILQVNHKGEEVWLDDKPPDTSLVHVVAVTPSAMRYFMLNRVCVWNEMKTALEPHRRGVIPGFPKIHFARWLWSYEQDLGIRK